MGGERVDRSMEQWLEGVDRALKALDHSFGVRSPLAASCVEII